VKIISFENLQAAPWKNGDGTTRELYRYPKNSSNEEFFWRVSIADIAQSNTFSIFPGIDRIISLLHGKSIELHSSRENITSLAPFEPHFFYGEEAITAKAYGKNCQDFNLMLRRGVASGNINVLRSDHNLSQNTVLLFCVQGKWRIADSNKELILECGQTLIFEDMIGLTSARSLIFGSILMNVNIYS
jgi:environmental stress-induced protein Ves